MCLQNDSGAVVALVCNKVAGQECTEGSNTGELWELASGTLMTARFENCAFVVCCATFCLFSPMLFPAILGLTI